MATVLSIAGSPSASSRTARLLGYVGAHLAAQGHTVEVLDIRDVPGDALVGADLNHPAVLDVVEALHRADGVVVGTPVYKASYSGVLKALLDLLPQYVLAGKTVLPLATGGSPAHALVVDYALRPVLSSMGALHILPGWFVLDRHITVESAEVTRLDPDTDEVLARLVDQFIAALPPVQRVAVA